jgi:spermidine synthase
VARVPGPITLVEPLSGSTAMLIKINAIHVRKRSKYQEIIIADTEDYGRVLILDDYIQSSYHDEVYYHESLVHPAMITHPQPRDVLIIGGGEGATLREALKHPTVMRAVMVDIDAEVVELSRQYLPLMHQEAFNDSRAAVVIENGLAYIERALKAGEKYDVVILDLTDPYASDIAKPLYTAEFYLKVRSLLREDGIMVTQAGSSYYFPEVYDATLNSVKSAFPVVVEYNVWVPSFGYAVNFIVGSLGHNPAALTAEEVDRKLRERGVSTLFYSGRTHVALMHLPVFRKVRRKEA